ncbi:tyrosine-type recombinase/integrase [Amphritea sp. HPY]|uniref:tyrosine-type recombinase/integrase n=1 Tax=Amphritea sp. HPY TaxID=3421652 RepID=UPI003D7C6ADC
MATIALTESFIKNGLICPEGKRKIEYRDTTTPGLLVEVSSAKQGVGTYYLRYRNEAGQQRANKLGRTTDLSLKDARKKSLQIRAEISQGADPRADVIARKAIPTFAKFMQDQYMPHAKSHKRTWKGDEGMMNRELIPVFGHMRLNQITRKQIQSFHTRLKEEGRSGAYCDHYIKLIRHALNLAVDWDIISQNPARRVPLFREDNRVENYMERDELERLIHVLRSDANRMVCNIALFLLSTGARLNEALTATWNNIDQKNRVWRIPAANSKSKKIRSVPLNDSALEIINQLTTEQRYEYLFINKNTGKPYTTILKVWGRLRKEAGLPRLRLHDLRHQYASFLVNDGRTLYEVQQILGHSDPSVTQRYAHLSSSALQAAAASASMCIDGAFSEAS